MGTRDNISREKWVLLGMWLSQPRLDDLSLQNHAPAKRDWRILGQGGEAKS